MGDVSKLQQDMIAGMKKRFNSRRKVDSEFAATTIIKAKFHYAILVADRSEAGRRPTIARASSLLVIGQIPARCRSATSLGPVCDQDSVMGFGFNEPYPAHCKKLNKTLFRLISKRKFEMFHVSNTATDMPNLGCTSKLFSS